jgi:HlyD family secretion protein
MSVQSANSIHAASLRSLTVVGLSSVILFAGTIGLWATATTWSGAVMAPGQFVVEGNSKKVQHQTGGTVGALRVREGDKVSEGDVLMRLDDTLTRANLQILLKQIDQLTARAARLEAERNQHVVWVTPSELIGRVFDVEFYQLLDAERALFEARRTAREGQRQQLTRRVEQWRNEIVGLSAQQASVEKQASLITAELQGVRELYQAKLVPLTRLNALEREAAALGGQRGQLIAAKAQTENKIAETELQILQISTDLTAETMRELRQVQDELAALSEKRIAAEDQLRRVEIKAPASGYVHQLNVHTVGGVVGAGEPVMLIVPDEERLQLEARIMPQDVDQLTLGQSARVRLHAFNQRTTPEIEGRLLRIAADVSRDPQGVNSWYNVRIAVPPEEVKKLGHVRLIAGMQADVFIQTVDRTPLEFLVRPIVDQFHKSFRER